MTVAQLRKQFQAANRRVDKAFAQYKALLKKLYVEIGGAYTKKNYVPAYCLAFNERGNLRGGMYITESYTDFYRQRKSGKFYMKITAKCPDDGMWLADGYWCVDDNGNDFRVIDQHFGWKPFFNDCIALKKLEAAIESAIDAREQAVDELEAVGIDVWKNVELWR